MTLLIDAGGSAELVAEAANPRKLICIVITHPWHHLLCTCKLLMGFILYQPNRYL
jgi:hypothetical protein